MNYSILDAHKYPVFACSLNLRAIDVLECEMSGFTSSHEALAQGLRMSPYCKVGYNKTTDNIDFVFGVAEYPDEPHIGVPWLLATDKFKITKSWLRHCRDVIFPKVNNRYPILQNYCHKENLATQRWLSWLGFSFYNVEGQPYYLFTKLGGNAICVRPWQRSV